MWADLSSEPFGLTAAKSKGIAFDRDGNVVLFRSRDFGITAGTPTVIGGIAGYYSDELSSVDDFLGGAVKTGLVGAFKYGIDFDLSSNYDNVWEALGALLGVEIDSPGSGGELSVGLGVGKMLYVSLGSVTAEGQFNIGEIRTRITDGQIDDVIREIMQAIAYFLSSN